MKFSEWLKVYSTEMASPDFHGVSYRAIEDMEEAWNMAKADCQRDLEGWTAAAYEDGQLDMEGKCQAEIVRMRTALEEIADIFTSETDPTRACHRIQAIVNRHKDRRGRASTNGEI